MNRKKAIALPPNPYWEVFKTFGRDEILAMIVNVIATFAIAKLLLLFTFTESFNIVFIAIAGPIFEKIGFYIGHFRDAILEYRNRLTDHNLRYFYKRAVKRGTSSLIKDILIHDPIYIVLMTYGLMLYGNIPEWILAIASFVIAVALVSVFDVTWQELSFKRFISSLKKIGFKTEIYYEVRFLINRTKNHVSDEILNIIKDKFDLPENSKLTYHDYYFDHNLKVYSTRYPKVRFRSRTSNESIAYNTFQIIYTKTSEIRTRELNQYRYFITKKWKIYKLFNSEAILKNINDVIEYHKTLFNKNFKFLVKRIYLDKPDTKISFTRNYSSSRKGLFVSVDEENDKKYIILELKIYNNKALLKDAMEFVMDKFSTIQTTKGKIDM